MNASYDDPVRTRGDRGPALYYGYCNRSGRYRMMDLPDYVSNVQQGMSRWMTDTQSMYGEAARSAWGGDPSRRGRPHAHGARDRDCGCDDGCRGHHDCHCECCIVDADVVVHARCGEIRRIPVTFANDTRRERPVTLELGRFVSHGGRDLNWAAQVSEAAFTLKACEERTVTVTVSVNCLQTGHTPEGQPVPGTHGAPPTAVPVANRAGSVERCEVGYATLRAEGCLVRPAVLAVAVLPDDCDAYRRPCSCGCCH